MLRTLRNFLLTYSWRGCFSVSILRRCSFYIQGRSLLNQAGAGFVLYMIVRECIYYVNLRQAYLSSSYYADRISSRTVMLTCVPKEYQDERRLRRLYGDQVKRVFIPRTSKALEKMVKERQQTAERLEKAEITLIRTANSARQKTLARSPDLAESSTVLQASMAKSTHSKQVALVSSQSTENDATGRNPHELELPESATYLAVLTDQKTESEVNETASPEKGDEDDDEDYQHPYGLSPDIPDVRGSVAAQWIPVERRPYHRPIGNFFRRVDTVRWTRNRLRELNVQIHKMRKQVGRGGGITLPTVFIEFYNQEAAQAAHQVLSHHRPLQMSSRLLGVRPDEVIWSCLRMTWWELIVRRFLILTLVTAAVIFWAVPSAFIGSISNIETVTKHFKFLNFLNLLPKVMLNFIQSFLPAIALSLLMAIVPWLLRSRNPSNCYHYSTCYTQTRHTHLDSLTISELQFAEQCLVSLPQPESSYSSKTFTLLSRLCRFSSSQPLLRLRHQHWAPYWRTLSELRTSWLLTFRRRRTFTFPIS